MWFSCVNVNAPTVHLSCNSNVDSVVTQTSIHPNISTPLHSLWKPLLCSFLHLFIPLLLLLPGPQTFEAFRPEGWAILHPPSFIMLSFSWQVSDCRHLSSDPYNPLCEACYNICSSPVFPVEWDAGESLIYTYWYASYKQSLEFIQRDKDVHCSLF